MRLAAGLSGQYNDYRIALLCSQYFQTHRDFILCLLRRGMGDPLLSRLGKYVLDTYYREEKGIAFYYTLLVFTGSFYNVYMAWNQRDGNPPRTLPP